jgi:hypothetical protein
MRKNVMRTHSPAIVDDKVVYSGEERWRVQVSVQNVAPTCGLLRKGVARTDTRQHQSPVHTRQRSRWLPGLRRQSVTTYRSATPAALSASGRSNRSFFLVIGYLPSSSPLPEWDFYTCPWWESSGVAATGARRSARVAAAETCSPSCTEGSRWFGPSQFPLTCWVSG